MSAERDTCSARSAAAGEPLLGTASRFRHWLMIEQPGPWGHDALRESGFPQGVGAALEKLGKTARMRVLLVKRRDRMWPATRRRCFVAFTGARERRLASFEIDDPRELLDMDLGSRAGVGFKGVGEITTEPLFLVCTHGKHDQCCARSGGPLSRAMAGFRGDAVWECTHIGGDRFAANLVAFPHGLYFGRVSPEAGRKVADGYVSGVLDMEHYRGRSCYSPPVQAAEHIIRRELDLRGVDDLWLAGHRLVEPRVHRVDFMVGRDRHHAVVEVGAGEPQLLTCKASRAHSPRVFRLLEMA